MSKFIDSVKVELSGKQKASRFHPCSALNAKVETHYLVGSHCEAYTIEASFVRSGFCRTEDLGCVQSNFIRDLREAVYGDLRDRIIRLERAMYDQDIEVMKSAIRDINLEIFG